MDSPQTSSPPTAPATPDCIASVLRFSRFYSRRVGGLLQRNARGIASRLAARVLDEIARRDGPTSSELGRALIADAGSLSRLLGELERQGLVERERGKDGRRRHLSLTPSGHETLVALRLQARDDIAKLLAPLSSADRERLFEAMHTIEQLLGARVGDRAETAAPYRLRTHGPGDLGWIVQRHGAIYAREYGWNTAFEALVAEVVAHFGRHHDPARERCWIAERDGENVGAVMLVAHPDRAGVAKLRLLLVEPSARGLGIGRRLVDECVAFARAAGYHTVTLWTNRALGAARRLYAAAGFRLVHEARTHAFGQEQIEETWEITLRA